MLPDEAQVKVLEERILAHMRIIEASATADGQHSSLVAGDDQLIQHLRNCGWSDIAVGAYLVVESTAETLNCDPALEMCAALYSFGGRVR